MTQPLEDELIGRGVIRHLTSSSAEQVSLISVEFDLSVDVDLVANDVRDRVARVRRSLPEDAEDSVVAKRDADAWPIMWLSLSGEGWDQVRWVGETDRINRIVHDIAAELGGSITAEHGVGRLRMGELIHYKSPVEIDLMRRLKRAFDPANILNPGKVLPIEGG